MQTTISIIFSFILFTTNACNTNDIPKPDTTNSEPTETKITVNKGKKTFPIKEYTEENNLGNYAQAIFAGGCFWCTEAAFQRINGVVDVVSGYSGGHQDYPSYGEVGQGTTGHTEAIYIYYDKDVITYETLLDVLFVAHDPTTLNRQGPDHGEEYRSAIYFRSDDEHKIIDKVIKKLNASDKLPGKIVTEVAEYKEFWVAEEYHQNYYELHPNQRYVVGVSRPKVEKVIKTFPELIKLDYRKR